MTDNATQREINFAIKVPGAQEGAQSMAAFAASLKGNSQSFDAVQASAKNAGASLKLVVDNTKQASESLKKTSDIMGGMSQNTSKTALVVGQFGQTIAKAAPGLETFAGAATRASSTIQNMSFLLGGGAGIAAGGLLLLVSTVAEKIGEARKQNEEFAKSQANAAKATADFYAQLKNEQLALRDNANAWAANLGKTGAVVRLEGELAAAQKNLASIGGARRDIGGGQGRGGITLVNERAVAAQKEVDRLTKELANARADKHYGETPKKAEKVAYDPGYTTDEGMAEYARESAAAQAASDRIGKTTAFAQGLQAGDQRVQEKKSALDKEFALQRAHTARMVQDAKTGAKSISAEYERVDKEAAQRRTAMQSGAVNAFTAVGAVGAQALAKLAEGQKMSFGAVLKGIGQILFADGLRDELRGSAEIIMMNPAGSALMGIGALEMAAGLTLIAGGTLAGGSRGGGGGGGGGRSGPNTSGSSIGSAPTYWNGTEFVRGAPSSPMIGPSGGSTGIVNINNNVTLQSYVTPNGDDAVRVQRAYDEAYRLGKLPRPRGA